MLRRPPMSTRTDTLFPYTTLFRSFPLFLDFVTSRRYREMAAFGNATYYLAPEFDVTLGLRFSSNQARFTERERGLLSNPGAPETFIDTIGPRQKDNEIGRTSCRERVCQYMKISVVAASV